MQRIDFPIEDDEHRPPLWRIAREGGALRVDADRASISVDIERVDSATHFVFEDDELIFIAIFDGDVDIDGTLASAGDGWAIDDEDALRIAPAGGYAYVVRLIEHES